MTLRLGHFRAYVRTYVTKRATRPWGRLSLALLVAGGKFGSLFSGSIGIALCMPAVPLSPWVRFSAALVLVVAAYGFYILEEEAGDRMALS